MYYVQMVEPFSICIPFSGLTFYGVNFRFAAWMLISKGKKIKTLTWSGVGIGIEGHKLFIVILLLLIPGESRMAMLVQDYLSLVETMHRLEKWPAFLLTFLLVRFHGRRQQNSPLIILITSPSCFRLFCPTNQVARPSVKGREAPRNGWVCRLT